MRQLLTPLPDLRPRARRGGALYPVLMIAAILLILSSMLPQVLVGASHAQRSDRSRERLLACAESGIAFAEARLKRQVVADVLAGLNPNFDAWTVRPSYDNPDFGPKKDATYAVKLVALSPPAISLDVNKLVTKVTYRLHAEASTPKGQTLEIGVSGMVTVECKVDAGGSGVAARLLTDARVDGYSQEL